MTDVIAIGEVLIDLTQTGVNENGIPVFAANPGGAPANVCVAVSRLGGKAAFIGKVGSDGFGNYLERVLQKERVNTDGLCRSERATTMAVVSVQADGERDFHFNRGADAELSAAEVDPDAVRKAKVFHFGSISLIGPESREATWRALHAARAAGVLVSYDPNYRASLWPDEQTAVSRMKEPLEYADLVKLSEEELRLLTGTDDLEQGSRSLSEAGIPLVLVTLGGKGAFYRLGAHCGQVQGVRTKVADTNGAGDTFLGAVLYQLCSRGIRMPDDITVPVLEEIIGFANRAASVTCSHSGAIPAMPTLEEI
nr:carbohydrate kinase [uncultured Agathobaculum sp.]